ncbi:MAG: hypothetical protein KA371_17545 [Acidobacteria bacterium]|nr:hypothetical protein [Acidobacteriota bacterium]
MGSPPAAAVPVLDDLKAIFGPRLEAFVTYAPSVSPTPSLALVTSLDLTDLAACATRVRRWRAGGAATPVVLTRREFTRSLDVFPVEFGDIIAHHETLHGDDPFAGLSVAPLDLRRACEGQIRSLLLHIREDYMEAAGASRAVAAVVIDSAAEFRALLKLVARLAGQPGDEKQLAPWAAERLGLDGRVLSDVLHIATDPAQSGVDAGRLFPHYLAATEALARHIDEWPDQ